ncbi:MAG TPA: 50S ribosomal protein L29 [Chthoniobacteraceae bacterium]|jgi:large subunit ribosomal protein L29|nr:50S ribosomal protein L29 [Chthoniobacteraceae bacterium]
MKIKEIRELTPAELASRKQELKQEIFHLRIQQQSGQLEKPSLIRSLRREVAQVETILTTKKAGAPTAAAK